MRRPLIRFKKVIIESPYRGDVQRNMAYLKLAMLDSINRGEAPSASHKLYTDILNDEDEAQRQLGLNLGFAWLQAADLVAFYTDYGLSSGMLACLEDLRTFRFRVPYEMRKISPDVIYSIRNAGC